jgi:hypothetical protein
MHPSADCDFLKYSCGDVPQLLACQKHPNHSCEAAKNKNPAVPDIVATNAKGLFSKQNGDSELSVGRADADRGAFSIFVTMSTRADARLPHNFELSVSKDRMTTYNQFAG